MKILLIEDEEAVRATLREALAKTGLAIALTEAHSRDSAMVCLTSGSYDYVICDLRIPTEDGGLNAEIQHGIAVFDALRAQSPGTLVRFLTGYGAESIRLISQRLEQSPTRDVYGTRTETPIARYFDKADYGPCIEEIVAAAGELATLDAIEIVESPGPSLDAAQKRVLQIFARRHDGRIIETRRLGGGLSSAKVLHALVTDDFDATRAVVVCKIDTVEAIQDERSRYDMFISPLLVPNSFVPYTDQVIAGSGQQGGIFYTFAEGHDRNLFQILTTDEATATTAVQKLEEIEERWRGTMHPARKLVGDIRRALISDEEVAPHWPALGADYAQFEAREIQVREIVQHCDLHGLNVLVDGRGTPVLIDYGTVAIATAPLDPLTLELSLLFHPEGKPALGTWPSDARAERWAMLDEYLDGCPIPSFVRRCRDWALREGRGRQAVYANAYAYALRQLRYPDTDHGLALAVARGVLRTALDS